MARLLRDQLQNHVAQILTAEHASAPRACAKSASAASTMTSPAKILKTSHQPLTGTGHSAKIHQFSFTWIASSAKAIEMFVSHIYFLH
ncbi:MAG: hypothetical protein PW789_06365 [Edaphobacter sp.]|uniref:hypothetical protein n=1 Tax=Edaphobacter sp. TaxID=1934404 RepID=UPI0023931BAF|nr:hypothetical protein [Edaphobacter sp.]MDE1176218.1 hypothetical protein [Edaphobacter sp.]